MNAKVWLAVLVLSGLVFLVAILVDSWVLMALAVLIALGLAVCARRKG